MCHIFETVIYIILQSHMKMREKDNVHFMVRCGMMKKEKRNMKIRETTSEERRCLITWRRMEMFKPDYREEKCPICGAPLDRKQFMGFGITAGYNSSCPQCGKYNDIWACGMREVDCGDWHSETFLSSYGTPTEEERATEQRNFRKLNRLIMLEKIKYFLGKGNSKHRISSKNVKA